MINPPNETTISLCTSLFCGDRRLRISLVGMPNSGKSTLFKAVSSTSINTGEIRATTACIMNRPLGRSGLYWLPLAVGEL